MKIKGINNEIEGVLFDMDGLLVNSEELYWQANIQAARKAGLKMPADLYLQLVGASATSMADFYKNYFQNDQQKREFIQQTDDLVWQWTDEGKLKLQPGVQATLDYLQKCKIPMAIVTSNTEQVVEHNLWVTGTRNYFYFLLNAADVKNNRVNPKPAPDIYLLAAEKMALPKKNLLAFEDSSSGLQAAVNAGIKCVMIPDLVPATKEDLKIATFIRSSFKDFLAKI